jgi:hypothetical protein
MQLNSTIPQTGSPRRGPVAFTLIEVLIASVIVVLVFGGIVNGYVLGAKRLQWSGYSLAAQTLSAQCLEQTRTAVWDGTNDEIVNMTFAGSRSYTTTDGGTTWILTGYTTNILDIPWKGTNYVMATNFITIQKLYVNNNITSPVFLHLVRVDTVWPFNGWGNFTIKYYSNSSYSCIAPDNRDPASLGITNTLP